MQKPVRYYITQSDDRAVVRSVPVSVRPDAPPAGNPTIPAVESGSQQTRHAGPRRARVARLVRAASRRDDLDR
ncbi:MAG: hypothetical protein QOG89_1551 [Thermomicrobiales bacterium]|nr:hypothetical protein [Thermomicrobiales bacterium]